MPSGQIMDRGQLYGRGISFPPRVGADGRIAWSEGEVNVREAIKIILQTESKERLNLPTFGAGLRRFLFEPNIVAVQAQIKDRITKALETWEPRILIVEVSVDTDPGDPQSAIATVEYRLMATQIKERVSVNVQLTN